LAGFWLHFRVGGWDSGVGYVGAATAVGQRARVDPAIQTFQLGFTDLRRHFEESIILDKTNRASRSDYRLCRDL